MNEFKWKVLLVSIFMVIANITGFILGADFKDFEYWAQVIAVAFCIVQTINYFSGRRILVLGFGQAPEGEEYFPHRTSAIVLLDLLGAYILYYWWIHLNG